MEAVLITIGIVLALLIGTITIMLLLVYLVASQMADGLNDDFWR